jgi:hypothetical protein
MRIFTVLVFSPGVCRADAERSAPRAQARVGQDNRRVTIFSYQLIFSPFEPMMPL